MKVIKDGKNGDISKWKKEVTCKKNDDFDENEGCGAELEIDKDDFAMMYWEGTHFQHHYVAVKCPQCGKYVRVIDVPDPIWKEFSTDENVRNAIFDGFSDSIY